MSIFEPEVFKDAFNLLCGKELGEGIHRKVFACRLLPDCVVKVEYGDALFRSFSNVLESRFYDEHQDYGPIGKWLAPIEYLSPDGRILIQKRVRICDVNDTLPDKLPGFLCDIKHENFGWYEGRLVAVDFPRPILKPETRLRKVEWFR